MDDNGQTRGSETWFVSRHAGAVAWARQQELAIDRWVPHLDPAAVRAGDTVIGTLPVHLAAAVCERGARYLHFCLDVPAGWRGRELTLDEVCALAPRLRAVRIESVDDEKKLEST
jgi:CRISPR-associated protein Csx16